MTLASFFGLLGTLLGLVRAFPQLLRLLRTRAAHGVSVDTALTSAIVSAGWVVYGYLTRQPFVSLATLPTCLIFTLVALLALRSGRSLKELRITPLWLAVLILSWLIMGKVGLGLLLPISVLVANLPQVWVAAHEGNLADLSLGTWLLCMADGLVWGGYALLQHDIPILFYGIFQLVTSGLIVALKCLRKPSPSLVSE